jgi:hypothetical protein
VVEVSGVIGDVLVVVAVVGMVASVVIGESVEGSGEVVAADGVQLTASAASTTMNPRFRIATTEPYRAWAEG